MEHNTNDTYADIWLNQENCWPFVRNEKEKEKKKEMKEERTKFDNKMRGK